MSQQDVYATLTELFTSHAAAIRNDNASISVTSTLDASQTVQFAIKKPAALADAIDLLLNSVNPLLANRAQFRRAGKIDMEYTPIKVALLRQQNNADMRTVLQIAFESFSARHSHIYLPDLSTPDTDAHGRPVPMTFDERFLGLQTQAVNGPSAEAMCKALRRAQNDMWHYLKLERPRLALVSK